LFAAERKKAIPTLPSRIGIVTSPQAAALRDILNILRRRHHTANAVIYPTQVQGESAAAEVAAGVRYFNENRNDASRSVEVIIVGRGGGSAEDLAAFNDEALARTVAASEIPVISAVGHETDFTIVDFVADLRAPTPSAAAELVIRARQEVESQAEAVRERLVRAMERRLLEARHALMERAQDGAFARMMDLIRQRQQKLDDLTYRLERAERQTLEQTWRRWETVAAAVRHYDVRRVLAGMRAEWDAGTVALSAVMRNLLLQYKVRAERMGRALEALSPLAILERGYALVFDGARQLVKDAAQVKVGQEISARLARGEIRATVERAAAQGETGSRPKKRR
jgi:exodeoxyribonuclease VII large subunit